MSMMPYENFTIRTNLSIEEVTRRLDEVIEPYSWFRMPFGAHKEYQGTRSANEFRVSRIIMYRNSFLPQITGIIREDLGQTIIDVTMKLHPIALIFTIVWVAVLGSLFVIAIVQVISQLLSGAADVIDSLPGLFYIALWLVLSALLTVGFFKFESSKSTQFFRKLLEDIEARPD